MNRQDYPNYPRRNLNDGCGHVYARPDGNRIRCGGHRICPACASDALEAGTGWAQAAISAHAGDEELRAAITLLYEAGKALRAQRDSVVGAVASTAAAWESGFSPDARGLFQTVPPSWSSR